MKLKLIRDTYGPNSTIGRLYCEGQFLCYTLENKWADNTPRISCIPEGDYDIKTKTYGRFYEKYGHPIVKLQDVPGRSEILIHKGNYPKDTLGCILLGDSIGDDAVFNSSKTYDKYYNIISSSCCITISSIE